MNEHIKVLSCWHKLEHFSPSPAPKASDKNVELLTHEKPWKIPLKSADQSKTVEYSIYLGVFDLSVVNDFVTSHFKNKEKDENSEIQKFAMLL